jgi:hypothetical protein
VLLVGFFSVYIIVFLKVRSKLERTWQRFRREAIGGGKKYDDVYEQNSGKFKMFLKIKGSLLSCQSVLTTTSVNLNRLR